MRWTFVSFSSLVTRKTNIQRVEYFLPRMVTNEHFLHVCALEKLSPFIVDRIGMRNKT